MSELKLHEAIKKLIETKNRPMSYKEIANELNEKKWYKKGDNSIIDEGQIRLRVKNNQNLFKKEGNLVSLKKETKMKSKIFDIADIINKKSRDYKIGSLQKIRKDIKKLKRLSSTQLFENKTISNQGWAFHYGGRKELQFNIGYEENMFRYGLAFSLEPSKALTNIDLLISKIEKLNSIIKESPELFEPYKMWYWFHGKRSEIGEVKVINSEIVQTGAFIFIGKLTQEGEIDYDEILRTFDLLLEIYVKVEREENVFVESISKICVFKPIIWNFNQYLSPSGFESTGGFSQKYGYGHEEWNNNPNWIWRGFKIFHTESQNNLIEFSKNGNLGIIMIASFEKKQYAVGIATNVYQNAPEERKIIAKELNIYDNYFQVWSQETVKNAFNHNWDLFIKHWDENYSWIQWKCPIKNYYWFEKPVLLNPADISGKEKLIVMHGSYQRVLPQIVLKCLFDNIKDSPEIIEWLTTGEFETNGVNDSVIVESNRDLRKKYPQNGANAPASKSFSYWVEGKREIEPMHAILQARYVDFLRNNGIKYEENKDYIDIKYFNNGREYYSEIKPTQNIDTKYAIRIAVGQLLEYRYFNNNEANLEIVLGSKPRKKEIEFLRSMDFGLKYFDEYKSEFVNVINN